MRPNLKTLCQDLSGIELFRMNPKAWGKTWDLEPHEATDAFLSGVLEGLFDLRWDYRCPHCEGVTGFSHHLTDAKGEGFCPACAAAFRNELDKNVEVTFTATARLWPWAPGEREALESAQPAPDPSALTGLDVLHRPLFRQRFSDEVLSSEESLEIRHVTVLFTDIRGSTALYERLGDAKAYQLVRDHFRVVFQTIEGRGGIVVKTIGDAVMASFQTEAKGLEAALEIQSGIQALKVPGTDEPLVVKMGLHSGPSIAVTLNDRFDYFGQTVNRAARVQGLASDQEIYFSEVVFQDPACRRVLASRKAAVRRWRRELKGIEGEQVVYSVR